MSHHGRLLLVIFLLTELIITRARRGGLRSPLLRGLESLDWGHLGIKDRHRLGTLQLGHRLVDIFVATLIIFRLLIDTFLRLLSGLRLLFRVALELLGGRLVVEFLSLVGILAPTI